MFLETSIFKLLKFKQIKIKIKNHRMIIKLLNLYCNAIEKP
jgi:hypothetical protein